MIEKTLTLTLTTEDVALLSRPHEVPPGAQVYLQLTEDGAKPNPSITGIRLEWSWAELGHDELPDACRYCGAYWIPYTGIGDAKEQRQHTPACPTHAGLADGLGMETR